MSGVTHALVSMEIFSQRNTKELVKHGERSIFGKVGDDWWFKMA